MNREQEDKFEAFRRSYIFEDYLNGARAAWEACLKANNIEGQAPVWTPKEGEAVFARSLNHSDNLGLVGRVTHYRGNFLWEVVYFNSSIGVWDLKDLKPFNASKIGKPWSEI